MSARWNLFVEEIRDVVKGKEHNPEYAEHGGSYGDPLAARLL